MAIQLQLRKGTTAENDAFTGASAEVTVDTTTNELRVHDGATQGGHIIPTKAWAENQHNIVRTNCVTEIPQDIKLELNAGTLTLKAGSKVYIPNGVGVFNTYTLPSDKSTTILSDDKYIICLQSGGSYLTYNRLNSQTGSGTTTPTSSYWTYYNTADNKVYLIQNGVNVAQASLPICIVTVSGGVITSIDQVFNGFGYIGSTVFVLPYFKALVPSGRNWNGTLYNTEVEITSVQTYGRNLTQKSVPLWIKYDGTFTFSTGITYDPVTNLSNNDKLGIIATADLTGGVISNWKPKTAFHAVDYNDVFVKPYAMGVPDYSAATQITSPWTATDNGLVCGGRYASDNMSASITVNGTTVFQVSTSHAGNTYGNAPVSKGDVVTLGGGTYYFVPCKNA